MKKVKVDCTPNPAKVIQVEIPDGSRWIHGDKNEVEEINGKKYRIIKVIKDGKQIGVINRMEGKFIIFVDDVTVEKNENTPTVEKCCCSNVPKLKPEDIGNILDCCGIEYSARQNSITDDDLKRLNLKPIGPQEPIVKKEGKIKSFFKRIFRIK
jgi:hypothetical protein